MLQRSPKQLSAVAIHEAAYRVASEALGITLRPTRPAILRVFAADLFDLAANDDGTPEAFERMALLMLIGDQALMQLADGEQRGRDDVVARELLWKAMTRRHGAPLKLNPSGLREFRFRIPALSGEAEAFVSAHAAEIMRTAADLASTTPNSRSPRKTPA